MNTATKLLRGRGKLRKEGMHLCNTYFEIAGQESGATRRSILRGYLFEFDPKSLLGRTGETLVLLLGDGEEQEILLLEGIFTKPRWQFRLNHPINPELDPTRMGQ